MAAVSRIQRQIGDRIRKLRAGSGLSMEELAASASIHPNTLGQIERGERNPTLSALVGIADGLSVELSVLVEITPSTATRAKAVLLKRVESMTAEQVRALTRILDAAKDL